MFELDPLRARLQAALAVVGDLSTSSAGRPPASVVSDDWVTLAGACQEAMNVLAAIQTVAVARVAATDDRVCEDGTVVEELRGLGHERLDAPALVQDALGLTASGATGRVAMAVDLVTRHPQVLQAMGEGRLDAYRAGIVAQELAQASPEVCAAVVERIGPRLGAEPGGALRRRTRRVLAAVDADLVRQLAHRARSERSLRRSAFDVGVDEWTALVPVEQSRGAWSVVDGLARSYVVQGRCARIDQARADALMDLIHARATGQVSVQLTVPASSMASAAAAAGSAVGARGPAEVPDPLVPVTGFGMPGVTQVRASWLAAVAGAAVSVAGAAVSRGNVLVVACDDDTGVLTSLPVAVDGVEEVVERTAHRRAAWLASALVDAGTDRESRTDRDSRTQRESRSDYRPPPWLVDFVKARDGHCRFPGCTVGPRFCDVDHVVAWPGGPTHPSNLACLCRRHHRVKQRPRWQVRMQAGAVLVWTDPCGRVHTTTPPDQLQLDSTAGLLLTTPRAEKMDSTEPPAVRSPDNPLPSALEDEIVHCLDRHHATVRVRLRERRRVHRVPVRRGPSSLDPPPF